LSVLTCSKAALTPLLRGLASTDRPQVGHFTDDDAVLAFLSGDAHRRLAPLGTSCPDHFLRTKIQPLVLDLPPSVPLDEAVARLKELHAAYRDAYRAYYDFVPKGKFVTEYTIRLNQSGRFELPPTRVEALYAPEMFGEAPNDVAQGPALAPARQR
jgi:rhamnose utilization protein RhaD (predicted bifunctional aldolase and dehydrogenase)